MASGESERPAPAVGQRSLGALGRIQAKREPEPWVESCDPLHWLRDA